LGTRRAEIGALLGGLLRAERKIGEKARRGRGTGSALLVFCQTETVSLSLSLSSLRTV